MYMQAEDVKLYMNLDIHQQVADFINKEVVESQKMCLEDLEFRLQGLLGQEVIGDTVSDVGLGLNMALVEVQELLGQLKEELKAQDNQNDMRWIPCITKKFPISGKYVLLSFANYSIPCVGRYEEDEEGGAFYIGDEDESCVSQNMIVNAWMPLPKCYQDNNLE